MSLQVYSQSEPGVNKIAVVRANALGDFVFALPALNALRTTYPAAEIVLLANRWHHNFLAQRPSPIDRVVVIPEGAIANQQSSDEIALDGFFAAMQQEKFDLAIQMHGGGRQSNPFTLRLEARLTVGLRTPDAALLNRWVPYLFYQPEVFRYLEVVSLVGARTSEWQPHLDVIEADLVESCQVVPEGDQPIVVLHPGASDPRRRWSVEKFAAVGDALVEAGMNVVVTGGNQEEDLAEAVVNLMTFKAQNVAGRLSLGGLVGLLSRCSLVVANDTGPLHVAIAVGTPSVGIYWCGNVITAAPMMRRWHRPAISWRLHCPVCELSCIEHDCSHTDSFVDDVSVVEVSDAMFDLLRTEGNPTFLLP